ncbi:hypothetical protein [Zoogloea sp.]|uniref:hypothetical protein n=1 Tax=Zoogloea sp. TaxID=49181 RepID=UPI0035AFB7AB
MCEARRSDPQCWEVGGVRQYRSTGLSMAQHVLCQLLERFISIKIKCLLYEMADFSAAISDNCREYDSGGRYCGLLYASVIEVLRLSMHKPCLRIRSERTKASDRPGGRAFLRRNKVDLCQNVALIAAYPSAKPAAGPPGVQSGGFCFLLMR